MNRIGSSKMHVLVSSAMTFLSIALPKLLWNLHIKLTQVEVSFSNKIDGMVLWNVLTGRDTSYRSDVLKIFFRGLFEKKITLGLSGIEINYFIIIIVELVLVTVTVWLLYKKGTYSLGHVCLYSLSFLVMMAVYIVGMCILYMFKFTEIEALELASLERYLGTIFLMGVLLFLGLIWKLISDSKGFVGGIFGCLLLGMILLITPVDDFLNVFNGKNIEKAIYVREGPSYLTEKIMKACVGNDRISLVNQGGMGQENLIIKYDVRPNIVIAKSEEEMSAMTDEVWREELISQYDYVAIYRYDDEFTNQFSGLFADPDDISTHGLYMVDKESGILYPVAEDIY